MIPSRTVGTVRNEAGDVGRVYETDWGRLSDLQFDNALQEVKEALHRQGHPREGDAMFEYLKIGYH